MGRCLQFAASAELVRTVVEVNVKRVESLRFGSIESPGCATRYAADGRMGRTSNWYDWAPDQVRR